MKRAKLPAARGIKHAPAVPDTLPDAVAESPRRRVRARWTLALIGVASLVAVIATSDRGRSPTDPLEECADYAALLKRCFNQDVVRAAAPPKSKEARAAAARQCSEDRARIERACR